jgi:hypothetical protein
MVAICAYLPAKRNSSSDRCRNIVGAAALIALQFVTFSPKNSPQSTLKRSDFYPDYSAAHPDTQNTQKCVNSVRKNGGTVSPMCEFGGETSRQKLCENCVWENSLLPCDETLRPVLPVHFWRI